MRVHVLEANRGQGLPHVYEYFMSRRYWFPVVASAHYLRDLGISVRFFTEPTEEIYECDSILISSRRFNEVFETKYDANARVEAIAKFRRRNIRLVWFDVRDSSGTTQFEVIPYVDAYAKGIFHRDMSVYEKPMAGGRVFTDYLEKKLGVSNSLVPGIRVKDQQDRFTLLRPEWRDKLFVGWDTSYDFGTIAGARYDRVFRSAKIPFMFGRRTPSINWGDPLKQRGIDVVAAFGMGQYPRETIIYQRKIALQVCGDMNSQRNRVGKLGKTEYFEALRDAKITVSCFGHGEICAREHEAWISGSAVIMPDMSLFRVYPDRYVAGVTYEAVEWSMDNLREAIDKLLADETYRRALAVEGNRRMQKMFSPAGLKEFAVRFKQISNGIDPDSEPVRRGV